jgi:hypothetical protein
MTMKFIWKGRWKEGEIVIEAQTVEELEDALRELEPFDETKETASEDNQGLPKLPSMLGCTDAVRALMKANWGKQPRTMNEIKKALEANELYFSKEALAATLVTLSKKGDIRRAREGGKWRYFAK